MSWLEWVQDRVGELLTALERIADALEQLVALLEGRKS